MYKVKLKFIYALMLASVAVLSTAKVQADEAETINIGFLAALSGPDAGWGLPGLTGNQMFVDRVNAGRRSGCLRHALQTQYGQL